MRAKRQGEVWWANLPEPLGWRPVLILTRSELLTKLQWVTVAPLTRTIRGLGSEVRLGPDDGLPQSCVVSLDNVATVEQDRLSQHIATLSPEKLNQVWEAQHYAFDLPY